MEKINVKMIKSMTYPDFVGFINQWNVLPGAHSTLSKWKVFSGMDEKSNILEAACTTGFSSREIALLSNCNGRAFDISKRSVEAAEENMKKYAPGIKIKYLVADGYKFETSEKFSHIILGASLKFFPDPRMMLSKCISMLQEGGYVLASPFYIKTPLPPMLVQKFEKVFGIKPTVESYKEIMKTYRGLEIIYEERNEILQETDEELDYYCRSTINRICAEKNIKSEEIYSAMYDRLMEIKKMSNELRPYQGYAVLVLRYRKKVYPNRYVELF